MKYEEILALLERGLTPGDIVKLSEQPGPQAEQKEQTAPAAPASQEKPAWADELAASMKAMTNAMHANALLREQQPEQRRETPEEALASALKPASKPAMGKK